MEEGKISIQSPRNVSVQNGGKNYLTSPDTDDLSKGREQFSAMALKRGFVIVSYGARSRGNAATDKKYLGHSPATATDTKAAIRYLRANKKFLKNIDTDKIILNGTSGGGAMTALIAAAEINLTFLNIFMKSELPGSQSQATFSSATPKSATKFSQRCLTVR